MTPELKRFDSSARTWLSRAGFPRDVGNSLVSAIDKTAQATNHMTEGELETYGHKEFEKLQRAYGEKLGPHSHLRYGHFAAGDCPAHRRFGIVAPTFWAGHLPSFSRNMSNSGLSYSSLKET